MNNNTNDKLFSCSNLYRKTIGSILDKDEGIDAEVMAEISLSTLEKASKYRNLPGLSNLINCVGQNFQYCDTRLNQNLWGCNFNNPLGLAAGFDKNGVAAMLWDQFGFGFAEIGTVTWHPQPGNPKPRLFRLAKEQAALNRMGFNNNGANSLKKCLEIQKIEKPGQRPAIIGINIGKSKVTPIDKAPDDYAASLEILAPFADYVVINVSSPNTPGLRDLQESANLRNLIQRLKAIKNLPPLLVKISPDLSDSEIVNLAIVAQEEGISGLIAVNTSLNRLGMENRKIKTTGRTLKQEDGGLSGAPIKERAIEVIRTLSQSQASQLPLIGVGGIDSPQAAWERISAGASLIQIYTGWIYKGPSLVPEILEGLISQLDKHGYKNINEAIGCNEPWI